MRIRRWLVRSVALAASMGLAFLAFTLAFGPRTTTSRLNPDETIRASFVDTSPRFAIDRLAWLRLEHLETGRTETLSPFVEDKGRPEGTERLIWSKDGAWLLLVGRHFFVEADLFLEGGDQLYFLHHLPTRRSWINSDLRARMTDLPALTAEQVRGVEFTEPVVLRPR